MKTYEITFTRDYGATVSTITVQADNDALAYMQVYEFEGSPLAILEVKEVF